MKLELQKHIDNITSRHDLIDALLNIFRKLEVISNKKKGSSKFKLFTIIASENKQVQND